MFISIGPASKTGCTAGATASPVAAPSKLRHVGHHGGHVASTYLNPPQLAELEELSNESRMPGIGVRIFRQHSISLTPAA